tara:strand:+ start:1051 stop:1641 length:591 start_codon:yes stop_codon:yes gene_type:complete
MFKIYNNKTIIFIFSFLIFIAVYFTHDSNLIIYTKSKNITNKMMTNGNWNKSKIENKNEHIQNMKDELFMLKYGYWLKIKDELEELDYNYEYKNFQKLNNYIGEFNYISKSKYPKIIIKKLDDPPKFPDNLINDHQTGHCNLMIIDKIDNNSVQYKHMNYQIPNQGKDLHTQQGYNEQVNIKIKSLESMIYLFENM